MRITAHSNFFTIDDENGLSITVADFRYPQGQPITIRSTPKNGKEAEEVTIPLAGFVQHIRDLVTELSAEQIP